MAKGYWVAAYRAVHDASKLAAYGVLAKLPADDPWTAPRVRAAEVFAVVSTMGQRDEEAILAAIALEPAYLGVVASRRRFAEIRDLLAARGVKPGALGRIRNPAGLDIGAKLPEEIALSILAEMVAGKRKNDTGNRTTEN